MTIKELKKHIKGMPDNAVAVFALWTDNDKYEFFSLHPSNPSPQNIDNGEQLCIIGTADNCRGHKLIQNEKGTFSY